MSTKKRIFVLSILFVMLASLLAGCGGTKASDKAVSIAKSAISVTDDYLDGKISSSEAGRKLDILEVQMDYVDDMDHNDKHKAADLGISVDILLISSSIIDDGYYGTSDTYNKVVEKRNDLAKEAGLKKR